MATVESPSTREHLLKRRKKPQSFSSPAYRIYSGQSRNRGRGSRKKKGPRTCHSVDLHGLCSVVWVLLPLVLYLGERYTCYNGPKLLYLLDTVHDILTDNEINYFLDYGTLLGFIRDEGPLEWDYDLDIGIHIEEMPKIQKLVDKFKKKRIFIEESIAPMCFRFLDRRTRIGLDVWCYNELPYSHAVARELWTPEYTIDDDEPMLCTEVLAKQHMSRNKFASCREKKSVFPLKTVQIDERAYYVPHDSAQILTNAYGDWTTPVTYLQCYHHGFPTLVACFYAFSFGMVFVNMFCLYGIVFGNRENQLLCEQGVD